MSGSPMINWIRKYHHEMGGTLCEARDAWRKLNPADPAVCDQNLYSVRQSMVDEILQSLHDMVAVAGIEGWAKETNGMQLIYRDAVAILKTTGNIK